MYARYVERLWKEKERRLERMWQPRIKRGIKPTKLKSYVERRTDCALLKSKLDAAWNWQWISITISPNRPKPWVLPSDRDLDIYMPQHEKQTKCSEYPAKTQIRLGESAQCPVWSGSSLCAECIAKDPRYIHADGEDSDQTGRMLRLIWVFTGRTFYLVLSCCDSYYLEAKRANGRRCPQLT